MTTKPSDLGYLLNDYMHELLDDILNGSIVKSRLNVDIKIRDKRGM